MSVSGEETFLFRTGLEEFLVRVVRIGGALSPEQRELARRMAFVLRSGVEQHDPAALRAVRRLELSLFDPEARVRRSDRVTEVIGRLEQELLAGRVRLERRSTASLTERREVSLPELPPLPPARVTSANEFFDVRFVDEVGQGIPGVAAEYAVGGERRTVSTNAAGVALLEGVSSTTGSITVPEASELSAVLDPRWTRPRPGRPPKQANTFELVFMGAELRSFPVKAAAPHLIVIKPPLGKLFVQLFDKTGRVPHAKVKYAISGPASFAGETDEQGILLHEDVFRGDYTLTITLEFFEGDQKQVDRYESPLVVLDAETSEPEVRFLGARPRVTLAQLKLFFNTNKSFVLPTTLPGFRELRGIYLDNNPSEVLVVGHADTKGGPKANDPLSLERAKSTIAFLKDDVDAWLAMYDQGVPAERRWGGAEDRMMLLAMPDFRTKRPGEDGVRWFQRTRGLKVDGKAGPATRKQLITEYMGLDGTSLGEQGIEIKATPHGCGENFPLDEGGEQVDPAAEDEHKDASDRRVELFFFDGEFGVVPAPAGETSAAGSTQYPKWRERVTETRQLEPAADGPQLAFIEMVDALFRTNSCVVMPEGVPRTGPGSSETTGGNAAGVIAAAIRFNQEHPGKALLIAGHADTTGATDFNQKLSQERAENVLALMLGSEEQRERWKTLCHERHVVSDYKQLLAWVARTFGFDCDPGPIDDNASTGVEPVRRFQKAYNANKAALGASAPDLNPDGSVGKLTWGAFFDCYQAALRAELGETEEDVAELRGALTFVDEARKALGFSEHFPIEELGVDDYESQDNRRVEILFFDEDETPDVEHAERDPETSEIYLPGGFARVAIVPSGGKRAELVIVLKTPSGEPVANATVRILQGGQTVTETESDDAGRVLVRGHDPEQFVQVVVVGRSPLAITGGRDEDPNLQLEEEDIGEVGDLEEGCVVELADATPFIPPEQLGDGDSVLV